MNHYIRVNSETLKSDGGKILELVSSAEKRLSEIYLEVNTLDGMWDGPANSAFNQQFALDYETFKGLCNYIKSYAEDLEKAAAEYERCENSVKEAIDAIKV